MLKSNSGFENEIIDEILELSADAQIERRSVAVDSPTFHNLSGAIAAYGTVLGLLIRLQRQEDFIVIITELALSECASEPVN
jgi:hypothetical protein